MVVADHNEECISENLKDIAKSFLPTRPFFPTQKIVLKQIERKKLQEVPFKVIEIIRWGSDRESQVLK